MPKLASTDPKLILNAARCFDSCVPPGFDNALKTYLLTQVTVSPCVAPTAPVILIVTNDHILTPPYLRVLWAQPANTGSMITSYTVSMGTTPGGPYPLSQTVSAVTFTAFFTNGTVPLQPGTTYYAVVVANSFAGCDSVASNEGSGTTNGGLLNGLLAYWKMDEASNVNRVDATGNGFTATQAAGNIAAGAGIINNGISQPGNGVTTVNGLSVSATLDTRGQAAPFSLSCWLFPTFFNAGAGYFGTLGSGGTKGFLGFTANNGRIDFYSTDDAGTVTDIGNVNTILQLNQWSHVVFVFYGTQVQIYVNGTGTGLNNLVGAGISKGQHVFVMGNYSDLSAGVPGRYDEFGYWNRALSANDVTNLYNGGAGLPFGSFT